MKSTRIGIAAALCYAGSILLANYLITHVGIGSVCRRQQTQGGREVVEHFAREGVRLHAFGLKVNGLREIGYLLASSDSLAWSYNARRNPSLPGCTHKSCSNCIHWAMRWRERILKTLEVQQPSLFASATRRPTPGRDE